MADACIFLMNLLDEQRHSLLSSNRNDGLPTIINIALVEDATIIGLVEVAQQMVVFTGEILIEATKTDSTTMKLIDISGLSSLCWIALTSIANLVMAFENFFKYNIVKFYQGDN